MKRPLTAALALVALMAAGCTSVTSAASNDKTTTAPSSTLILRQGGTVNVAVRSLPTQFNPFTAAGSNAVTQMVMEQVWPQPFVVNNQLQAVLDDATSGTPGSGLLVSAEVIGVSPQTVVYTINPKASWSDGVPITSLDFRYDWLHQLAYATSLPSLDPLAGYEDIASITGSNNGKTMTVVFKTPFSDWQALFSDLIPAHIAEKFGWAAAFARFDPAKVISGGPYMITSFVPGKMLVLSRNLHFWAHHPLLDHIVFRVVRDDSVALAGLVSGRIDLAAVAPSPVVDATVAGHPYLDETGTLTPTLWQLGFNLADPVVSDLLIREAIAKSIDRNQLVTNTIGLLTAYGQTAGNRVYAAGAPGSQGNDGGFGVVDISEADALFEQAGYHLATNGRIESPSGEPLALSLVGPKGDDIIDSVEAQIAAQLLQAGVAVTVDNVPKSRLLDTVLPTGAFQLAVMPYAVSAFPSTTSELYTDPVGPTPIGSTDAATTTTSVVPALPHAPVLKVAGNEREPGADSIGAVTRDVLGYDDPQVTALYASASAQLNASAASGLYNEIDTRMWLDLPTLPLFQMPEDLVFRADLVNVSGTQTPVGALWNAQDWAIQLSPVPTTTTTSGG